MSSTTTLSSPRKRRADSYPLPNSSDTEPSPVKRRRWDWPTSGIASARRKSVSDVNLDLEDILRRCAVQPIDQSSLTELQEIEKEHGPPLYAIKKIIRSVRLAVRELVDESEKLLETELYLLWLEGYQPVLTAVENILSAKLPGTRRRVPGLGWICFTILYHLIDEYVSEVNAHQDGWSHRSMGLGPSDHPSTMSLAEESKDSSADERSEVALANAGALFNQYDTVMAMAVRRYKAECGKTKRVACSIGRKECALGSSCCLLCEQTGFGSDGVTENMLLTRTRALMRRWRNEYGSEEQENYPDSDDYRE